jgi:DNA-binding transcriptional MerR regulator
VAPGGSANQNQWPADDRSLCERIIHFKGNPSLDPTDSVGPGATRPNIRRVYKVTGPREDRHTVLVCREVDTNLDGIKDVVRTFNDKGEPQHEEADSNYDGLIDRWITFVDGRIAEEDVDETLASGRPNVWKYYLGGSLARIRRNTHCPSGKPDTWEIYVNDRLERVGNDLSCDGHVDRWDRDAQLQAKEESAAAEANDAGSEAGTSSALATALPEDAGAAAVVDSGSHRGDGGASKTSTRSPKQAKARP